MKNNSTAKAQSAIEYLMTYGWMLLVVAIVGGAIFSMIGDQSIESVSGFNSNEIHVNEFGATANSLQMNVESFGANNVELKEVRITKDTSQQINIPLNKEISAGENTVLNLPHFRQSDSSNDLEAELIYNMGGLTNLSTSGTITAGLELESSLVGYWTLSENQANETHVHDISQNQNHGEIIGDLEFSEDGNSLKFDEISSESKVQINDHETLDITDSMTLAVRANHTGYFQDSNTRLIVKRGSSTNHDGDGYNMALEGLDNGVFSTNDRNTGVNVDMSPNQWHHIVWTIDSENEVWNAYVNGEKVWQYETNSTPESINSDIAIGNHLTSNRRHDGHLKDARIYNRALSEDEVKAMYNNPGLTN